MFFLCSCSTRAELAAGAHPTQAPQRRISTKGQQYVKLVEGQHGGLDAVTLF